MTYINQLKNPTMKKIITVLVAIASLTACKKDKATPAGPGTQPVENVFYYRAAGSPDTALVYHNGQLVTNTVTVGGHYEIAFNKGDSLTFFYTSAVDSAGGFNFAIWNAGNFPISETIRYYYPQQRGASQRYYIKGTFKY